MCSIFPGEHSTIRSAIDQSAAFSAPLRNNAIPALAAQYVQHNRDTTHHGIFLITLPIRKTNAKAGAILCCFTVIGLFARKPLKNPRFQVVPQQSTQTKL